MKWKRLNPRMGCCENCMACYSWMNDKHYANMQKKKKNSRGPVGPPNQQSQKQPGFWLQEPLSRPGNVGKKRLKRRRVPLFCCSNSHFLKILLKRIQKKRRLLQEGMPRVTAQRPWMLVCLGRCELRPPSSSRHCPHRWLHLRDNLHAGLGCWSSWLDALEARRWRKKVLHDVSLTKVARAGLENMDLLWKKEETGKGSGTLV